MLHRCGHLHLSAPIPNTSVTRYMDNTIGSLSGGRAGESQGFLRSSGRGESLPPIPQVGQELLVIPMSSFTTLSTFARLYISFTDSLFASFSLHVRLPLFYVSYFLLYLFESFKQTFRSIPDCSPLLLGCRVCHLLHMVPPM